MMKGDKNMNGFKKFLRTLRKLIEKIKSQISKLLLAAKRRFPGNHSYLVLSKQQAEVYCECMNAYNIGISNPSESSAKVLKELEMKLKSVGNTSAGKPEYWSKNSFYNSIGALQTQLKKEEHYYDKLSHDLQRWNEQSLDGDPNGLYTRLSDETKEYMIKVQIRIEILNTYLSIHIYLTTIDSYTGDSNQTTASESFISFCDELYIPV
jgi:hypothetical protein